MCLFEKNEGGDPEIQTGDRNSSKNQDHLFCLSLWIGYRKLSERETEFENL
jgi:hypothetical protein